MASQVYSTRFIGFEGSAGASQSYTVPAGYTVVVASIVAQVGVGTTTSISVQVDSPLLGLAYSAGEAGQVSFVYWNGRVVLNAGEQLTGYCEGPNGSTVAVSGYLLSS